MCYFAEIDENNVVVRVLRFSQAVELNDGANLPSEYGGRWIRTSFNGTIRKRFAGIGYTYDEQRDAFILPQPYPSWVLNEETCRWEAPVAFPDDGGRYEWDEQEQGWVEA